MISALVLAIGLSATPSIDGLDSLGRGDTLTIGCPTAARG